jgi:hypothetical protein
MTATRREVFSAIAGVVAGASGVARASAQPLLEAREVRQIVTFRFLPGQLSAVLEIYATHLLPIYREIEAIRMVRLLTEAESPEPLDLMVITHYDTLAGMDRANDALARQVPDRPSVGELYRQIADLSLGHTDQFVELVSPATVTPVGEQPVLEVLEFLRIAAAGGPMFERHALSVVHPWEQETSIRDILLRSETSRFLIADGWDHLRTYAVRSLGAWQAYVTARSRHGAAFPFTRMIEQRKTMVLRELAGMRVR